MSSNIRTFKEAATRIQQLPELYKKGHLTDMEFAGQFYNCLVEIKNWETIRPLELDQLINCVEDLPPKVREILVSILVRRERSNYSPIKGLGVRINQEEQLKRIPYEMRVSKGLIARIKKL